MSRDHSPPDAQIPLPLTPAANAKPRPAWAPAADNNASLEAAAHVSRTGRAARIRRQVLSAIASAPATDQQLEERLQEPGNTIRPRRKELLDDGLVEHSGDFRPTTSGRKSKVYRVTPAGLEVLRGGPHGQA